MALSDAELKKRVRSFTTDDVTDLPDAQILYLAGRGEDTSYQENIVDDELDSFGVVADAWAYLARDEHYMSETEGAVSVSQPTALRWAAYYGALSVKGGGASVTNDVVSRKDLLTAAVVSEHGLRA